MEFSIKLGLWIWPLLLELMGIAFAAYMSNRDVKQATTLYGIDLAINFWIGIIGWAAATIVAASLCAGYWIATLS